MGLCNLLCGVCVIVAVALSWRYHAVRHERGRGIDRRALDMPVAEVKKYIRESGWYCPGVLRDPEIAQHDVSPRAGGRIERLYATDGMHVRIWSVLADVYNPEVLTAEGELLVARGQVNELADADQTNVKLLEAARQKLVHLGFTPGDVEAVEREGKPRGILRIRSPVEGHILEKRVVEGSVVRCGETIFRIVQDGPLGVEAYVREADMALVKLGQAVQVYAIPNRPIEGSVILIHPHVDVSTCSAKVLIKLKGLLPELKAGMYATVEFTSESHAAVLAPCEAIIDTGLRKIAFIPSGDGQYEPREVTTGRETGDGFIEILEGLQAGESVVSSAQFLLDSESSIREAVRQFTKEGFCKIKD